MTQKDLNVAKDLPIILQKLDDGNNLGEEDWKALMSHTTKLASANGVSMVDFSQKIPKIAQEDLKALDLLGEITNKLGEKLESKEFGQKHLLAPGIYKKLTKLFLTLDKSKDKNCGDRIKDNPSQGKGRGR